MVKAQWCQLCNLNEQYRTMKTNIHLLRQLEQLALNRFSFVGTGNLFVCFIFFFFFCC